MTLDLKEVIKEITSKPKWYWKQDEFGEYSPDFWLLRLGKRIKNGSKTTKPETIKTFLNKFGYEMEVKYEVRKVKETKE